MTQDPAVADFIRSTTNHTPNSDTIIEIEEYRDLCQKLASLLIVSIPSSRARSIALTHLEEAVMWGVKAMILRDKDANSWDGITTHKNLKTKDNRND